MVGVLHPTRRKNEGKNLDRKHLELSERRVYLLGKSDGGSGRRGSLPVKKHNAARARSRLVELTFGTLNVRTAAVNGVNGIRHIDTLLGTCAAKGCDVIVFCRRPKGTELAKFRHLDTASRAAAPLDMVHVDTAGPFPESLGGSRYVVMFVDSASRFKRPYGTRDKSALAILGVVQRFVADM